MSYLIVTPKGEFPYEMSPAKLAGIAAAAVALYENKAGNFIKIYDSKKKLKNLNQVLKSSKTIVTDGDSALDASAPINGDWLGAIDSEIAESGAGSGTGAVTKRFTAKLGGEDGTHIVQFDDPEFFAGLVHMYDHAGRDAASEIAFLHDGNTYMDAAAEVANFHKVLKSQKGGRRTGRQPVNRALQYGGVKKTTKKTTKRAGKKHIITESELAALMNKRMKTADDIQQLEDYGHQLNNRRVEAFMALDMAKMNSDTARDYQHEEIAYNKIETALHDFDKYFTRFNPLHVSFGPVKKVIKSKQYKRAEKNVPQPVVVPKKVVEPVIIVDVPDTWDDSDDTPDNWDD